MGEVIMNNVVEYFSLTIWIIYFFLALYREVRRNKDSDIKMILKHPFHFIRIDSVFFLGIYLTYNNFARDEVLFYLYGVIVITSLVYLLYDLVDNYGFNKINKKDYKYYLGGCGIVIVLAMFWLITKRSILTSTLTLVINLLIPSYVSFINWIKKN